MWGLEHRPLERSADAPRVVVGAAQIFWEGGRKAAPATASQKRGYRYEARAHDHLRALFEGLGATYYVEPRVCWHSGASARRCYPDAVVRAPDSLPLVLEVKVRNNLRGGEKLLSIYRPVVEKALGSPCQVLEVCQFVDPLLTLGSRPPLSDVDELADFFHSNTLDLARYRWSG